MPTKEELRQELLLNIAKIQQAVPDFTMTEEQIEECLSDQKYKLCKKVYGRTPNSGKTFDNQKDAIIKKYCDPSAMHPSFARNRSHMVKYEVMEDDKAYNKELFENMTRDDELGEEAREKYIQKVLNIPLNYDLDFLASNPSDEQLLQYSLDHEDEGAIGMAFSSYIDQLSGYIKFKDKDRMKQYGRLATSLGTYIQKASTFIGSDYYLTMPFSYLTDDQFARLRDNRSKFPGFMKQLESGDETLNNLMTYEEMKRMIPRDVQNLKGFKPIERDDYEYEQPKELRIAGGLFKRAEKLVAACGYISALNLELVPEKLQALKDAAERARLLFVNIKDIPSDDAIENLSLVAGEFTKKINDYIKDDAIAKSKDPLIVECVKALDAAIKVSRPIAELDSLKNLVRIEREDRQKAILEWYRSLKETLQDDPELNLDITKPTDMISIKTCDFKVNEDTIAIGDPTEYRGSLSYAFIPKNLSADNHFDSYNAEEEPPYPGEEGQQEIIQTFNGYETAFTAYGNKLMELEEAYNKNAAPEKLDRLEKELAEAKKNRFDTYKTFAETNNRVFGAKHAWSLKNQKQFDPDNPDDFKQIEYLYQQAEKGLLYIDLASADSEQKYQIGVNTNTKTAEIIKTQGANVARPQVIASVFEALKNGEPKESLGRGAEYYDFIAAHYKEFEKENGTDIRFLVDFKIKPPVRPAEVPKPGALSWVKFIFSIGFANGDFKKYEKYERDLADYNRKAEEYPRLKEETRKRNLASYEGVIKFINKYSKELGMQAPEGVKRVGELTENMIRIHYTEENPLDLSEEYEAKGISSSMLKMDLRTDAAFRIEAHEKPEMFNEDWVVKADVSKEYWDQKNELQKDEFLNKITKYEGKLSQAREDWKKRIEEKAKQQKLEDTKQIQAEMKEAVKKNAKAEKIENEKMLIDKQNALYGKNEGIKEQLEDLKALDVPKEMLVKVSTGWASKPYKDYIKDIGKLFTDNPEELWEKGVQALGILACQNQEYYADGTEKPFDILKTSSEILPEVNTLIDISNHPEKKETNKALLEKIKNAMADPNPSHRENTAMIIDSMSDIASRELLMNGGGNNFADDMSKVSPGLFICAGLARSGIRQNQKNPDLNFDLREGFAVHADPNKPPVSIADARETVLEFADKCANIRVAIGKLNKLTQEYKEMKENPPEVLPKVKDLSIKRSLDI